MQSRASTELQRVLTRLGDKIDALWGRVGAKYVEQLGKSTSLWKQIS